MDSKRAQFQNYFFHNREVEMSKIDLEKLLTFIVRSEEILSTCVSAFDAGGRGRRFFF